MMSATYSESTWTATILPYSITSLYQVLWQKSVSLPHLHQFIPVYHSLKDAKKEI